ncbi:MAG: hypothetical protein ABIC57_00045 [bacterium]
MEEQITNKKDQVDLGRDPVVPVERGLQDKEVDNSRNLTEEPKISLKPKEPEGPKLDSSQVIKSEPKKETSLFERLNNWIIPIISLIILVIVSIFVLIPSANDTMDTLDEIRTLEQQIVTYESKIDQLKAININDVNSSLQIASQVIKDDLEVGSLAADVEALARNQDLETKSVSFSSSSQSQINVPGYVKTISGPFSYSGTFKNLSDFIADLRTKSPTIVALREVSMSKSGSTGTEEEDIWTANFVIDAFTTSKVEAVTLQTAVSSSINQELMNEINERLEYSESLN